MHKLSLSFINNNNNSFCRNSLLLLDEGKDGWSLEECSQECGRRLELGAGHERGAVPLSVFQQPTEVVLMLSAARLELQTLNSETRRDADTIRAQLQGEKPTSCFLFPLRNSRK